jgi:hypothetical protein
MILPNIDPRSPSQVLWALRLIDEKLSELLGIHGKGNFRSSPDSQQLADTDPELPRFDQIISSAGFVPITRTITAGAGLAGGGDLSINRTFAVGDGDGINILADSIEVDEGAGLTFAAGVLVVDQGYAFNWTGAQTWANTATFNNTVNLSAAVNVTLGMHFPDNIPLYFGTGDDSTILYDGTNLLINPDLVGTGYLDVSGRVDADKYTVTYTTARTAQNNIESNVTIAGSGMDVGTTYQGEVIDMSYIYNDAAGVTTAVLNGLYMDFDVVNTAAILCAPTPKAVYIDMDIGLGVGITDPKFFYFDMDSLSTSDLGTTSGVFTVEATAPTASGIACYTGMTTTAVATTAGFIAGYEGYAHGSLTYTGKIAGVWGFTAYTRDAYGTYGIASTPSGVGTSCAANRTVGFMANAGSIVAANGNLIIQTGGAVWLRPVDVTTSHLNFANAGQGYVASAFEVDGVAYFDNATTAIQIGAGAAGVDYRILVDGETNDGIITWMEDEDYFKFSDGILMDSDRRIYFRDANASIYSSAGNSLNFVAAGDFQFNQVTADTDITLNFIGTTNSGIMNWFEDEDYFRFYDDVLFSYDVDITENFCTKARTPAQIVADQNDYNPGNTAFLRLSTDAARTITGISGGRDGRQLWVVNVGAQDLLLAHQNAGSAAANRIITYTAGSVTLNANESCLLIYDATDSRWRTLSVIGP